MLDLTTEDAITLAAACRLVPPARNGRKTHISTLVRWIAQGVKAPDGTLVRLEAARLGGRWVTSRTALQRFAEALTPRLDGPTSTPRTPGKRQRANEQAAAELAKNGI
jgi:hypothetical protein